MGNLNEGRGNFICSLRFYASNALAGALYLVTIFVGKDTLAASCGFFALHNGGEMALCFSSFFYQGNGDVSPGVQGEGSQSTGTFPFLFTQYSDEGFFFLYFCYGYDYLSKTDAPASDMQRCELKKLITTFNITG